MKSSWFLVLLGLIITWVIAAEIISSARKNKEAAERFATYEASKEHDSAWLAPTLFTDVKITGKEREMVMYGQDLIAHTSKYFGPRGSIAPISNGMNCQNCHLDAGTRQWGNNYGGVYSTYPQLRARSNTMQQISGRVNDCLQRSLNGKTIANDSYEMKSIYAYMKWLGQNVPKGKKPHSSGLPKLPFLSRAASPEKGKLVYINVCQSCHGDNGQGTVNASGNEYIYPPLWGQHSYNDGAGLYRVSSFASFVKNNMPYNKATRQHPTLSNEEAWDVAAFVNSQPRPHFDQSNDWPDLAKKPFDAPFGLYADSFSEKQHKYGPFEPIVNAKTKNIK
jgi:thiosulfate dehydrogenase